MRTVSSGRAGGDCDHDASRSSSPGDVILHSQTGSTGGTETLFAKNRRLRAFHRRAMALRRHDEAAVRRGGGGRLRKGRVARFSLKPGKSQHGPGRISHGPPRRRDDRHAQGHTAIAPAKQSTSAGAQWFSADRHGADLSLDSLTKYIGVIRPDRGAAPRSRSLIKDVKAFEGAMAPNWTPFSAG